MPRILLFLAAITLAVGAACNDDGRTLAPAPTVAVSAATTSTSAPTTQEPVVDTSTTLELSSPSFASGEVLSSDFTCDGLNVPPPLVIGGVPGIAVELAITVVDRDADGFVHWVLAGLDTTVTELGSGVIPPEAVSAQTDSGVTGWDGPCPPPGDDPHEYAFTVHALAEPIELQAGMDGREAIERIESVAIATSTLIGRYGSPAPG